MDFVRLGERYSSEYMPDYLLTSYSSIVFTERHLDHGNFEVKTYDVDRTMDIFPEGTLVSHLETDDVQMVETLLDDYDEKGRRQLTMTGRSLGFYTGHRFVDGPYQAKRKMRQAYSPAGAALVLLWQAFDNTVGVDVTQEGDLQWSTFDAIPNVVITDSTLGSKPAKPVWLTQGELAPQLKELMDKGGYALRVIRPWRDSPITAISVKTALAERGNIERISAPLTNALRFDLYSGINRTESQSSNPRVVFSLVQGHLESPSYFQSNSDQKTIAEIMSRHAPKADVYLSEEAKAYKGLRRRVLAYDASNPDIKGEPTRPDDLKSNASKADRRKHANEMDKYLDQLAAWRRRNSDELAEFQADATESATRDLGNRKTKIVLDGTVSGTIPYTFKEHYNLGDRVTMYARKGAVADMVVSEYIRSEDRTGDKGYPALTVPETD